MQNHRSVKNRILPFITALCLASGTVFSAYAAQAPAAASGSETVYAELSNEGKPVRVTVLNSATEEIIDAGTKELPWEVTISYRMNGKPVTAEELAEKKGRLDLSVDIKKGSGNTDFFDDLTLIVKITLDTARCRNITCEGGSVSFAGLTSVIAGYALPGKGLSMHLSADVLSFEMPAMEITAMDISPDTGFRFDDSAIRNEIDSLKTLEKDLSSDDFTIPVPDTAALIEAAGKLEEGTKTLSEGADELSNAVEEAADAVISLSKGSESLLSGMMELNDGSAELKEFTDHVESILDIVDDHMDLLPEKIREEYYYHRNKLGAILSRTDRLAEGSLDLLDGAADLNEALQEMNENTGALKEGTEALKEGSASLHAEVSGMSKEIKSAAEDLAKEADSSAEKITEAKGRITGRLSSLENTLSEELKKAQKELAPEKHETVSFLNPSDKNVSSVQFMMTTEGIHKSEEKQSADSFYEKKLEVKKPSFLDRILIFFGLKDP
ncbi:MAG: hypothetical protein MJ063_00410 [Lachnospiraceae bacterium]|nr:hypothetical protein [Lachnospiraceae bacterium]